jgi:lipopolysaccharide export system protein LptC
MSSTYVNKRTAHRWRLLFLMLGGVFCAFGSFWLAQVLDQDDGGRGANAGNEPDYIVENFSFVRMSETGQPRYVISGERLTHRPVDNTSDIDKPVVQALSTDRPHMTMTSQRAHVSQNQNQIDLAGDVDIRRPGSDKSQPLHITTESLTLLPDDEIARTAKPIRMTMGSATVDAVGMVANNATQQIQLGGRGRATYPPRQAPAQQGASAQ